MRAYLDHNATSPLRPEARERWLEVQDALGGNPSSLHEAGRRARAWIDEARERVAAALAVGESEAENDACANPAGPMSKRPGAC